MPLKVRLQDDVGEIHWWFFLLDSATGGRALFAQVVGVLRKPSAIPRVITSFTLAVFWVVWRCVINMGREANRTSGSRAWEFSTHAQVHRTPQTRTTPLR